MRQVYLSDYREVEQAAALYNQTDAFKEDMRRRPLIEPPHCLTHAI